MKTYTHLPRLYVNQEVALRFAEAFRLLSSHVVFDASDGDLFTQSPAVERCTLRGQKQENTSIKPYTQ